MTDQSQSQSDLEQDAQDRVAAFQDELDRIRRELDHNQRLTTVGTMAAGVAHEVNNLLTPALSYARLAERSPDDHDLARKAVRKSIHGIEASARILQAILEFTSPSSRAERAGVAAGLDLALDCLGRHLEQRGITLHRSVPPGLDVTMSPLALQQILLNLLLNARRVLGSGGEITVRALVRPDGQVVITVADNGPGIPEEIADTLFEPFVTAGEELAADRQGGSGLGLAVCRRLVESAGGTIDVRSTAGTGATFEITLPAAPADPLKNAC